MDHASNVVIDSIDFVPETLMDAEIHGDEDTLIGRVTHVHGIGPDSKIVIDVGGFLGFGAKSVMMPVTDMTFMRDDNGSVHGLTSWTKAEVKALPEHDE
jgi:ribosomal 30S subunit maturation factor RimM